MLMIAMPRSASTSILLHISNSFKLKHRQLLHLIPGPKTEKLKSKLKLTRFLRTNYPLLAKLHGDAVIAPEFLFKALARSKMTLYKQHFTMTNCECVNILFLYSDISEIIKSYKKISQQYSHSEDREELDWDVLENELNQFQNYWFDRARIVIEKRRYLSEPSYQYKILKDIQMTFNLARFQETELPHLRKTL